MKKSIIIALLFAYSLFAKEINILNIPNVCKPGSVMLIMEEQKQYFSMKLLDIKLDNNSRMDILLEKKIDFIKIRIPDNIEDGSHSIKFEFDDNVFGVIDFQVIIDDSTGNQIDGTDPDPDTQNGKPKNLGKNPKPVKKSSDVYNPSGGHLKVNLKCDEIHRIDGKFTVFDTLDYKEWSGIIPLKGQFSNLYLDFCAETETMYLMNDWVLGNGIYDSTTCYNLFEFMTAGGSEQWYVKVYNSIEKGVEITRNGVDVSNDTNIVVGGRYGYNKSPLDTNEHTMWEFGLKVQGGLYVMRLYKDEVAPVIIEPNVKIICDEEKEGWGLVQAPETVVGYLDEGGMRVRKDNKYIPPSGAAGLETEPTEFSGNISGDSITVFANGEYIGTNKCNDNHIIDGRFSENEWDNAKFATGQYSNIYADYCNGVLYVLNDWVYADKEPFEKNCYNLFELYTGDGSEHWGIFVYHDPDKGIKIFRNGVDVSEDSVIVVDGAYSFETSPNDTNAHTIYEFAVTAQEGGWHLYMCDPAPSSFCDENAEAAPRQLNNNFGLRINENDMPGYHTNEFDLDTNYFELYLGTQEIFDSLYSKQIKININIENESVILDSIKFDNKFLNANNIEYYLNVKDLNNSNYEIIINSNDNLTGTGDILKLFLSTKNGIIEDDIINSEIIFGNKTTDLFKKELANVKINNTSGYYEQSLKSLSYYPNPVYEGKFYLNMEFEKNTDVSVSIYDINARKYDLMTKSNQSGYVNYILDLNNFNSGEYFIRVNTQNKNITIPVIIINK